MFSIEYIAERFVDSGLDKQLRDLLTVCFTGPEDEVFKVQRYWIEPPQHRWFIRSGTERVIANVVVHEKAIEADGEVINIGGVGDVCVHPEYRGRGFVRDMLAIVHKWLASNGYPFAVLFGNPQVYASSGYFKVNNLFQQVELEGQMVGWEIREVMVKQLTEATWPCGEVRLKGLKF